MAHTSINAFVYDLHDMDKTKQEVVGGKGANLGELIRMKGIRVPDGFCISTEAFKRIIREKPVDELLHQLSLLKGEDREAISELSSKVRRLIEGVVIPGDISEEITHHLSRLGQNEAYAVRSSATAEDLPTASFAGQQDTYLNIVGKEAILQHISKCWASLFTERAVMYRIQAGFDHRKVYQAVVVQKMIFPQAAGIMFTADPVTGNRKVVSIDAGFGLGEALVGGLVNADNYKVRDGKVMEKKISAKKAAIRAAKNGGTKEQPLEPEQHNSPVLTDEQIIQLERIGRTIEEHFGHPQDIEWCLADESFYIVQSRPITTLYPIPDADDEKVHVYVSVGHQQMMTDPIKPLGLSFYLLTTGAPMRTAGGRLFVDVTPMLASPAGRETLINVFGKSDLLLKDALMTIIERDNVIESLPGDKKGPGSGNNAPEPLADYQALKEYDPSIVADLMNRSQTEIEALKQAIQSKSGLELFDFIVEDIQQLKKALSDPQSLGVIMTAMNAAAWINHKMEEWLGEKAVADTLSQSVPNNITSQMGLALLDVADAIRPYPAITGYLQALKEEDFLDDLAKFEGGQQVREAIRAFLNKYGMRCAGEIDITRTRWSEQPKLLVPLILNHIKNFTAGESHRRFEQGLREALKKEKMLLAQLRQLPDGQQKVEETSRMIRLLRNFAGYREYPKYAMMNRYFVYKQALLGEAEGLVQASVIRQREDIYYLTFEELREVVRTGMLDYGILHKRKDDYKTYERLTPPRVITSDGEIVTGKYEKKNLPPGAIAGLAVSSGLAEGRARVVLNMEEARLEEGDILVTTFTDPSWTPLFVSIKGLVTEVGGLMTHGAVIAREYGLPAVVGVENATRLIKDGQRIKVNGTEGYVEIL